MVLNQIGYESRPAHHVSMSGKGLGYEILSLNVAAKTQRVLTGLLIRRLRKCFMSRLYEENFTSKLVRESHSSNIDRHLCSGNFDECAPRIVRNDLTIKCVTECKLH